MNSSERHEFQAEVQQLLDLMIHSLYSNREVCLRELISNASDALDKLRFERLSHPELGGSDAPSITLTLDPQAKTLSIADNGIGMRRDEVVANIGTIAKSGTKEFLKVARQRNDGALPPELIGQFGVGFYSAFMVADRVTLITRHASEPGATQWTSTGDGSYELQTAQRDHHGTTITLELKAKSDDMLDLTSEPVVRSIVKKYSDFVAYPIFVRSLATSESTGTDAAADSATSTPVNSMKAIWDRPKAEVTEQEYREFYHHISHDWSDPLRTIPVKMEGTLEAYALMYLPRRAPFDLYSPEMKRGLQLYVKRVFVMEECKDLLPSHLRFVRGVVDAHDLSLNVSREILQQDRQIQTIRKQLVKKILAQLEELKNDHREEYLAFWAEFGPVLKEGLLAADQTDRDRLLDLVLMRSTASQTPLSLAEYAERRKPDQKDLFVLTGAPDTIASSPLLEAYVAQGYEVLLLSDPIDELWLERVDRYREHELVHIGRSEVKLGSEEQRQQRSEALSAKQRDLQSLLDCLRAHVQDTIKEVRLSDRLTSSAACLVSDEESLPPRMARLLEQMGQKPPPARHILELNPEHPVVAKLRHLHESDSQNPLLGRYAQVLLGQAYLADSGHIPNPATFTAALNEVLTASGS